MFFYVLIYIRKFMRFDSIKIFLFLLFLLVIVLSYLGLPWFAWSDGVEHAAAIKELSDNFFHPQNPLLSLDGSTSPRFVPSIMLMALFMKITHAEISSSAGSCRASTVSIIGMPSRTGKASRSTGQISSGAFLS